MDLNVIACRCVDTDDADVFLKCLTYSVKIVPLLTYIRDKQKYSCLTNIVHLGKKPHTLELLYDIYVDVENTKNELYLTRLINEYKLTHNENYYYALGRRNKQLPETDFAHQHLRCYVLGLVQANQKDTFQEYYAKYKDKIAVQNRCCDCAVAKEEILTECGKSGAFAIATIFGFCRENMFAYLFGAHAKRNIKYMERFLRLSNENCLSVLSKLLERSLSDENENYARYLVSKGARLSENKIAQLSASEKSTYYRLLR